jgi:trk system potassium uptake protein TrkH
MMARVALSPRLALPALVAGGTLVACGLGMLACSVVAALTDGEAIADLAVPGAGTLAAGAGLAAAAYRRDLAAVTVRPVTGYAAVTGAWTAAALVGALPLLAWGGLDSLLDAYFEAMSGFTTTGATLMSEIERVPDGVLLWRSMTQWLGGVGIVVLVVAVAPAAGAALQGAFYAEVSGVTAERLTPRIVDTAKIIVGIYLALSAACAVAYLLAGMGVLDAVNHSFTTLATGGFSTRTASFAAYDSLALELVAIVFMALASLNFAFYWKAIRGAPLLSLATEVVAFLAILAVAIAAVTVSLLLADDVGGLARALRDSAFTVTSIISTTGFATADSNAWNEFARLVLLGLMVIGACAGSTAGGIKVIRALLLAQAARQEVERQLQPSSVQVLRLGGRVFGEPVRVAVLGYALLYTLVFVAGALALAASGLDLATAVSGTSATLNVVGPGFGDVGAVDNYEALPTAGRLVAIVLMLAGRLEIFALVALLAALISGRPRRAPRPRGPRG